MRVNWLTMGILMAALCLSLSANHAVAQEDVEGGDADGMAEEVSAGTAEGDGLEFLPRFRWGISGYGGPMRGGYTGGGGGMDLRLGVQITEMIGAYLQPMFLLGVGLNADSSGGSAAGMAFAGTGALAEFDFIDLIYVGIGPQILSGALGEAGVSTTGATAKAATGPFFGLAARVGVALGSKKKERRSCFTVGLDMHTVFYGDGAAVLPMIALGYDRF